MSEVFDFRTLKPGTFDIGPFTVRTERVSHPVEAFGFRIEHGGRSLTYSGDTGPCEALDELAEGTDLFLCEASFTHGKEDIPDLHLNGREAGETRRARRGGPARPDPHPAVDGPADRNLADARAVYDGPVELARPGRGLRDLGPRVGTAEPPTLRTEGPGLCRTYGRLRPTSPRPCAARRSPPRARGPGWGG